MRPESSRPGAGGVPTGPRAGARRGRSRLLLPALLAALAAAGCDIDWGGTRVSLEPPEPPENDLESGAEETADPVIPLPDDPLLYFVRIDSSGRSLAVPVGRITGSGIADLDWPRDAPTRYRSRFDSAFSAAGTELALHASGSRAGSLILDAERLAVNEACPSVARGRALLIPGERPPETGFALLPGASGDPSPRSAEIPATTPGMRRAAPALAERYLEAAGVTRSYLAQRAELAAVRFSREEPPGLAATYLINDTLAPGAPGGSAASLFYLVRSDGGGDYAPVWTHVRTYETAAEKVAFAHHDRLRIREGTYDVVRRVDGENVRLAARLHREERAPTEDPDWTEGDRCASIGLLEAAARQLRAEAEGTEEG